MLKVWKTTNPNKSMQSYTLSKWPSTQTKSFTMATLCSKSLSYAFAKKTTMKPFTVWKEPQITTSPQSALPCTRTSRKVSSIWSNERLRKVSRSCPTFLRSWWTKIKTNRLLMRRASNCQRLMSRRDRQTRPTRTTWFTRFYSSEHMATLQLKSTKWHRMTSEKSTDMARLTQRLHITSGLAKAF